MLIGGHYSRDKNIVKLTQLKTCQDFNWSVADQLAILILQLTWENLSGSREKDF